MHLLLCPTCINQSTVSTVRLKFTVTNSYISERLMVWTLMAIARNSFSDGLCMTAAGQTNHNASHISVAILWRHIQWQRFLLHGFPECFSMFHWPPVLTMSVTICIKKKKKSQLAIARVLCYLHFIQRVETMHLLQWNFMKVKVETDDMLQSKKFVHDASRFVYPQRLQIRNKFWKTYCVKLSLLILACSCMNCLVVIMSHFR